MPLSETLCETLFVIYTEQCKLCPSMAKKTDAEDKPLTAQQFAEAMGVHYRTVLNWLHRQLIPGAVEKETPFGAYWEIPRSALTMEKPRPGPKPKKARKDAKK